MFRVSSSKPGLRGVRPAVCVGATAIDRAGRHTGDAVLPSAVLEVLVLVANDHQAALCANCNGETRPIRAIRCGCQGSVGDLESRADCVGSSVRSGRMFARELIAALERDAEGHDYAGVFVLADSSIHDALRRIPVSKIPNFVITHLLGAPLEWPASLPFGTNTARESVQ